MLNPSFSIPNSITFQYLQNSAISVLADPKVALITSLAGSIMTCKAFENIIGTFNPVAQLAAGMAIGCFFTAAAITIQYKAKSYQNRRMHDLFRLMIPHLVPADCSVYFIPIKKS